MFHGSTVPNGIVLERFLVLRTMEVRSNETVEPWNSGTVEP